MVSYRNDLDYHTYLAVAERAEAVKSSDNTEQRNWYATFEGVFKKQTLEQAEDLYKFIAFAYSWMPTVPSLYFDEKYTPESFLPDLQALRAGKPVNREDLVNRLSAVVNNSVVGTSKVLHFIAPQVPIIDSRVIVAWRILFNPVPYIESFPKNRINDRKRMVKKYLKYWKHMEEWLSACQRERPEMKMRDLEVALYWCGGNLRTLSDQKKSL